MTEPFASLDGEQFMVLTTFRLSGEGVPTTVWFAQADGVLYVTTQAQAGKTKRIRATPRVLVAPSDRTGIVHGPAVEGSARLLNASEFPRAIAALREKYGQQYENLTAQMDSTRPENTRVFLEISHP